MLDKVLHEMLESKDLTLQQLADMSDVPIETLKNLYYGKVKDPKVSTVLKLSECLNVSMNFLMGKSLYNEDETRLIQNYRRCEIHGKSIIDMIAEFESHATQRARNSSEGHVIPCLVPIGKISDGILYNSCEIREVMTTSKSAHYAIEITTNYFAPAYCKGDKVLLEKRFPENGEQAVFSDGERVYFRKYIEQERQYILRCLNGAGKDIVLKRMDTYQCIGTCIGIIRT